MPNLEKEKEQFVRQIARLLLSTELTDSDPVGCADVLDWLITKARELTGELPEE